MPPPFSRCTTISPFAQTFSRFAQTFPGLRKHFPVCANIFPVCANISHFAQKFRCSPKTVLQKSRLIRNCKDSVDTHTCVSPRGTRNKQRRTRQLQLQCALVALIQALHRALSVLETVPPLLVLKGTSLTPFVLIKGLR